MTAVATREPDGALAERDARERDAERRVTPRLFERGGPTLEDSILAAWDELAADRRVECPVCGGSMSLPGGCDDCGSELS
jgi:hypothetical protein